MKESKRNRLGSVRFYGKWSDLISMEMLAKMRHDFERGFYVE